MSQSSVKHSLGEGEIQVVAQRFEALPVSPNCQILASCSWLLQNIFLPNGIIFVSLHLLSRDESGKQEKLCNIVLLSKSANFMRKDGAFMLSLVCVYYIHSSISSGVRYVPQDPVSSKVFGDT